MLKKRIIMPLAIAGVAHVAPASAAIINIPDDYPTIQEGIAASIDGDTVLVQPGTYVENVNFNGHNITLGSLFLTTGDTSYIEQTTIDGDSSGSVVTFESGEDSTTVLTGFTITEGVAVYGGGIYCDGSDPIISFNTIRQNSAVDSSYHSGYGGGIYCRDSNPTIRGNRISENDAHGQYSQSGVGGGIFCDSSIPQIIDNTLSDNWARRNGGGIAVIDSSVGARISGNRVINNLSEEEGGGIYCDHSSPQISNNLIQGNLSDKGGGIYCLRFGSIISENEFAGNSAAFVGGGLYLDLSDSTVSGNIFRENMAGLGGGTYLRDSDIASNFNVYIGNFAGTRGGGLCIDMSSPQIANNTFTENISWRGYGGGIYCRQSGPTVINTILWADSSGIEGREIFLDYYSVLSITYCDVQGGWEGEGNIDCYPLFCNPDTGNFYLAENSCCVAAGENGEDIGAYEVGCGYTSTHQETGAPQNELSIRQNYPNPFNSETVIRYSLERPGRVTLAVYNLLGQRVTMLFDGAQTEGRHTICWNAGDLPSGIYIVRLLAGGHSETIRVVLQK